MQLLHRTCLQWHSFPLSRNERASAKLVTSDRDVPARSAVRPGPARIQSRRHLCVRSVQTSSVAVSNDQSAKQTVQEFLQRMFSRFSEKPEDELQIPEHWQQHTKKLQIGKQRALLGYFEKVKQINELEPGMQCLTDAQLKAKTAEFKQQLSRGASLDDLLVEAFAVVREVSKRVLRLRHFDAQMVGGIVLHEGFIAEMKTGEGKTLVATLPAYLNALTGKGVHVVTVNDYLAERDANSMGKIFKFLGQSVAVVKGMDSPWSRKPLFAADITYLTAQTLCFTYLQDNTALFKDAVAIRRPFNFAIVDEVDSLLIDECKNPMIITTQLELPLDRFNIAKEVVAGLKCGERDPATSRVLRMGDFFLDRARKGAWLSKEGLATVYLRLSEREELPMPSEEEYPDVVRLWQDANPWGPFLLNALKAEHLYVKDRDYVVNSQKEVKIINPITGRVLPLSRWQDNLHQAVEAKEGVPILGDSTMQASITYQCFFKYYAKLAGMTGTAATEAPEFFDVYDLNVVEVPSRLPNQRLDIPPRLFFHRSDRLVSLYLIVMEAYFQHRPVLIGTASVEESDIINNLLADPAGLLGCCDEVSQLKAATAAAAAGRETFTCHQCLNPAKMFWRDQLRCTLDGRWSQFREPKQAVSAQHRRMLNARPENVRKESQIVAQAGLPAAVTIATNMAGRGTDIVLGGNPRGLALQILLKFYGSSLLTGEEFALHEAELSDIPLTKFSRTQLPSNQFQPGKGRAQQPRRQAEGPWSPRVEELQLPESLLKAISRSDLICSTLGQILTLEQAQREIGKVLDGAEALLAQVLSEHWPGEAFNVEQDAAEALGHLERLFEDDFIPDLQEQQPAQPAKKKLNGQSSSQDEAKQSQQSPDPSGTLTSTSNQGPKKQKAQMQGKRSLAVVYRKTLTRTAVHLLLHLEHQCQIFAKEVKKAGGLLVIGTNFQDSRRSENQLRGRTARQGDEGQSIMMYDMDDPVLSQESTLRALRGSKAVMERLDPDALPYLDFVVLRPFLRSTYNSIESHGRGVRAELRQYDEIMEVFRQHVYSLRRLILSGSVEQTNDVLRRYFQEQADAWVQQLVDVGKAPRKWGWAALRKQVNKVIDPSGQIKIYSTTAPPPPQLPLMQPLAANPAGSQPHQAPTLSPLASSSARKGASDSTDRQAHQQSMHSASEASTTYAASIACQEAVARIVADSWKSGTSMPQQQTSGTQQSPEQGSWNSGTAARPQQTPGTQQSLEQGSWKSGTAASPRQNSGTQQSPEQGSSLAGSPTQKAGSSHNHQQSSGSQSHRSLSTASGRETFSESEGIKPEREVRFEEILTQIEGLSEEDTQQLAEALTANQALRSPAPPILDLQYKAKVSAHRKMLRDLNKGVGVRPRLAGHFAPHAEQLRDWLGEFLLAKYQERQMVDRALNKGQWWLHAERDMMLKTLDDIWTHFLREMAGLQTGVPLRSFSRMDPLQEFKLDAGAAFLDVLTTFKQECVYQAFSCQFFKQRAPSFKPLPKDNQQSKRDGKVDSTSGGNEPELQLSAGTEGLGSSEAPVVKPINGPVQGTDGDGIAGQDALLHPSDTSAPGLARV